MSTCDQIHTAPTCADPACYRELNARKADEILPGLGDLVRKGTLDPKLPTSAKLSNANDDWEDHAKVIQRSEDVHSWVVAAIPPPPLRSWKSCDRSHAAPPCTDPDCYCEEHARRADTIMPGLGDFVRRGVLEPNLWVWIGDEMLPPLRAMRAADPRDPYALDRLSDVELTTWATQSGVYNAPMEGTYLRFFVDELHERRAAEAAFAAVDQRFQRVDCAACDEGPGYCPEHMPLVMEWQRARDELLEQARIHRGYLRDGLKDFFGKVPP